MCSTVLCDSSGCHDRAIGRCARVRACLPAETNKQTTPTATQTNKTRRAQASTTNQPTTSHHSACADPAGHARTQAHTQPPTRTARHARRRAPRSQFNGHAVRPQRAHLHSSFVVPCWFAAKQQQRERAHSVPSHTAHPAAGSLAGTCWLAGARACGSAHTTYTQACGRGSFCLSPHPPEGRIYVHFSRTACAAYSCADFRVWWPLLLLIPSGPRGSVSHTLHHVRAVRLPRGQSSCGLWCGRAAGGGATRASAAAPGRWCSA